MIINFKNKKAEKYIMPKKCLICEEEATFAIKDTNDYYCKECAEEQFDDTSYLVPTGETTKTEE